MRALIRVLLIALSFVGIAMVLILLAPTPRERSGSAVPAGTPAPGGQTASEMPAPLPDTAGTASRDVTPPSVTNLPATQAPLVRLPPRDAPSETTRESRPVLLHQPVAVDTGTIRIGDGTVQLSGVGAIPLDEQCGSGAAAWPCGMRSRTALRGFLRARSILCQAPEDFGSRQETLESACEVRGADIGDWIVRNGWGTAADGRYADAEAEARTEGRGIWRGE